MRRHFFLIGFLCVILPATSLACVAGMAYEKNVGDFKAEMSYDAYRIRPGQTVRLHFDLNNVTHRSYGPGNPIDYEFVEVTLKNGNATLFTQSVERVNFGETAFEYTVPDKNADYVAHIRFVKKGADIAALSLPLRVGRGNIWRSMLHFGNPDGHLLRDVTVKKH